MQKKPLSIVRTFAFSLLVGCHAGHLNASTICPLPAKRPAGMTVIVIQPGVMSRSELRRILFNGNNRQLTVIYDTDGIQLLHCRGNILKSFTKDKLPQVIKDYARKTTPFRSTRPLTLTAIQQRILPDAMKLYRETLEHLRVGYLDTPSNLNDSAWEKMDFYFILDGALQHQDGMPIKKYGCKDKDIDEEWIKRIWKAALSDFRMRGFHFNIQLMKVFVPDSNFSRSSLYALGVNIGMSTHGKNARLELHNNARCFFQSARYVHFNWENCKLVNDTITALPCPIKTGNPSRLTKVENESADTLSIKQTRHSLEKSRKHHTASSVETRTSQKNSPGLRAGAAPLQKGTWPADIVASPITERLLVLTEGKTPAAYRAKARLLSGKVEIQLQYGDRDGTKVYKMTSLSHSRLALSRGSKQGIFWLVINPSKRGCANREIVVTEVRLEGKGGTFLGLARHFRRLSEMDCRQPVRMALE